MSFNDYPLGQPRESATGGAATTVGGTPALQGSGGAVTLGGSEGVVPSAGSATAGAGAMGGSGATGATGATGSTDAMGGTGATGGTTESGGTGAATAGGTVAEAGSSDIVPADGGAGGMPSVTDPDPGLLDDFEDGDPAIVEHEGRSGSWYISNDGRGIQTPMAGSLVEPSPLEPARTGSSSGAHTFGGPFFSCCAYIAAPLAQQGAMHTAYDLSRYTGIRLWVRSGTSMPAPMAKKVRLNLPTPGTTEGGSCTICGDHFGVDVALTTKWVQVEVPFATLKQLGTGRPRLTSLDLRHVTEVQLSFVANTTFDLWLDDVEFY